MTDEPRTRAQRKSDVLEKLSAKVADTWVATSDGDGPYLVPLTMAWFGDRIVLATAKDTPTARNIVARGRARLALGDTRDVVMIDATLERTVPVADAGDVGDAYVAQSDWDPRTAGDTYVFLILVPARIQAWREVNEIPERTLMRDGVWLV
ncbi:pyridoxamine 5'-phosphate oxidase family protein [Actinoplanes sp. NPDC049118]|uniref:pyridoxamine 5'-phosphate oxidase family protein n=1 Tax=Actinoplanes sp. NPDC049118 TaxID=3155769 RepID=UPI0033FFFB7D